MKPYIKTVEPQKNAGIIHDFPVPQAQKPSVPTYVLEKMSTESLKNSKKILSHSQNQKS